MMIEVEGGEHAAIYSDMQAAAVFRMDYCSAALTGRLYIR
jgi:hypothetical protein